MVDKRVTKDEAARQIAAADKRVKGISSIASNTIKRSRVMELQKEYSTKSGNKHAVTSVDKALRSLTKSTEALAHGVKIITVETARGVKNITAGGAKAMSEYSRAISEDISINRQNFMVTAIGKFTPLAGYAVAKMMETAVFKNMIERMKQGLGRALNSITSRLKAWASGGWEKGKEVWGNFRDSISGKRGAVKTKLAKAREAKREKRYITKESAIKDALADAKVSSAVKKAARTKDIEKQVPHMAVGGLVKKEGLAKIHAAEVVQPIDKLIETIVKSVTETIDKRDAKKNKVDDDSMTSPGFFKKAKKKDLFGFQKVSDTINRGFDIATRKSLKLETRIMKRDKVNQKGLIGSFMEAYSNEAKQEELPLMERQVRATLELKKTISGENKTFSAAISKMLYEHPAFHASLLAGKGMGKLFSFPFKFFFRRRGKSTYAQQLSTKGTVFEQLANTSGQLYSLMGLKLDDIIANTYVSAKANASIMSATQGAKENKSADVRKAPAQKASWTVAGSMYKYLVKKPAEKISSFMKKVAPDSWKTKTLTTDISPKAAWKAAKKVAKDKLLGTEEERARKKADRDSATQNVVELYRKEKEKKDKAKKDSKNAANENLKMLYADEKKRKESFAKIKEKEKVLAEKHDSYKKLYDTQDKVRLDAKVTQLRERENIKKEVSKQLKEIIKSPNIEAPVSRKAKLEEKSGIRSPYKDPDKFKILKKAGYIDRSKVDAYKRSFRGEPTGNKDRTGQKTTTAHLSEIVRNTKATADATKASTKASGGWFSKIKGFLGLIVTGVLAVGSYIMSLPGKLFGLFSKLITKLAGGALGNIAGKAAGALTKLIGPALGPVAAVAAAGAAGYAVGTLLNKKIVTPIVDKMYKASDDAVKEGATKADDIQTKGNQVAKDYREGKEGVTLQQAQTGSAAAHQKATIQRNDSNQELKDSYGLFSGVNFQRVTSAQAIYMGEHAGEYVIYGDAQVDNLRAKWDKENRFRGRAWIIGETWEKYGENREKAFLAYLKLNGKPLTAENRNKEYEKRTTLTQKAANAKANAASPEVGFSKTTTDKIDSAQAYVTALGPVANQFLGNTTTGRVIANWIKDKSNDNPAAVSSAANKIVSLGETKWRDMGGSQAVFDLAKTIVDKKSGVMAAIKDKAASAKNSYFDVSAKDELRRASGMSIPISKQEEYFNKGSHVLNQGKGLFDKGLDATKEAARRGTNMYKEASGGLDADAQRELNRARAASGNQGDLATIKTAITDGISTSSSYLKDIFNNPKEYAKKVETSVWGNLDSLKNFAITQTAHLQDLLKISKDEADYQLVQRGIKGGLYKGLGYNGGSLSYQESQINNNPSKKEVVDVGVKKDLALADRANESLNKGINGMKDMAEKTSKQTTNLVNSVMNSTTKIMSNTSNNNAGNQQQTTQRPPDDFMLKILHGYV